MFSEIMGVSMVIIIAVVIGRVETMFVTAPDHRTRILRDKIMLYWAERRSQPMPGQRRIKMPVAKDVD